MTPFKKQSGCKQQENGGGGAVWREYELPREQQTFIGADTFTFHFVLLFGSYNEGLSQKSGEAAEAVTVSSLLALCATAVGQILLTLTKFC